MNEIKYDSYFEPKRKKRFRKKSKLQLYSMIKNEARRFCMETGLHGFQYIARPENNSKERFIWTFLCFGALLAALVLSGLCWIESSEPPTFITTDSMQYPISNYVFPGIAICNLNQISREKAIKFLNETLSINISDKETKTQWLKKISILAQMYYANEEKLDLKTVNEVDHILTKHSITAEEALVQMTPSCLQMLKSCMWKQRKIRCDSLFQKTRTPEGTCCTFNNFSLKNRTFEGYMANRYKNFPRHLSSCGVNSGMTVLIKIDPQDYLASELSAYGAKVMLHYPLNYPDWNSQRILIPLQSQVYSDINPTRAVATEDVRKMSIEQRGCVMSYEKELKIYANYSYGNCIMECRISILQNICGCIPFYLRNEWMPWTPFVKVCGVADLRCIAANKMRFTSSVPGYDNYKTKQFNHKWGTELNDCKNCIPDCEYQVYTIHNSKGTFSIKESVNYKQFYNIKSTDTYSSISIFFKSLNAIRNKRDVSVTWTQIFGIFGGLLGICLGFTFISAADVFYTFTLRLFINIWKKKEKQKKIDLPASHNNLTKAQKKDSKVWFIN